MSVVTMKATEGSDYVALYLQGLVSWPMRTLAGGSSATTPSHVCSPHVASVVPKAPCTLGSCSAMSFPDSHLLFSVYLYVRVYVSESARVCVCD